MAACFRLLSAALLLKEAFDCCFPVVGIGLTGALGSEVVATPLIMAVAMMERGSPVSATIGSERRAAESCRYAQERSPIAPHALDSGLPTLCLRQSPAEDFWRSKMSKVDVQRCFEDGAKAGKLG